MKIEEEINRLKEVGFIYDIEHIEWVSLIVVVLNKNGKLCVCSNLQKVNATTIRDSYPFLIKKQVLERVLVNKVIVFWMN